LPIAPSEEAPVESSQQEQLTELGRVSAAQEAQLQLIALERVPSELPFRRCARILKRFKSGCPTARSCFITSRPRGHVHAFAVAKDRYAYFTMPQPAKVKADVGELLRQMGHHDRSQPVAIDDLKANGWKPAAQRLLGQLTNNAKAENGPIIGKLVHRSDGVLWYLPFEALPGRVGRAGIPASDQV